MMYCSILVSFCLLGIASSQTINAMTACLTKDQNLIMNCTFTPKQSSPPATCVYTMDKKLVASTNASVTVDPTYKKRATVNIISNKCTLILTGYSDDTPKMFSCNISQDTVNATMAKTVEKKTTAYCSDGNVLNPGGVILLLVLVLTLLSDML